MAKEIRIKKARFENFKKLNNIEIEFGSRTEISAQNWTGKSSIADGIFWVLFGKSSTGKSEGKEFRPRPYDAAGIDIDHIDVVVELTIENDGTEIVLRKAQRQNWVRKRGTEFEVHEGDRNIYSWNNVEISETEFKARISDIVSEKNFMLITDPTAFFRLTKAEKLDLIMSLVNGISEEEILEKANTDNKYGKLLEMIRGGKTLEEIRATSKRSITDMTKERDKISASIAERQRDIVEVDVAELELQRNDIKRNLDEINQKMESTTAAVDEYSEKQRHIMELKAKQSTIENAAIETLNKQRREAQKRIDLAEDDFRTAMQAQKECELELERLDRVIAESKAQRDKLMEEYSEVKGSQFHAYEPLPELKADDFVCPTCGQLLPAEKKEELLAGHDESEAVHRAQYDSGRKEFEESKKKRISDINATGSECAAKIKEYEANKVEVATKLEAAKSRKISANKEKTEAMEALKKIPAEPDLSENQLYEKLVLEIKTCEDGLRSMNTGADYREQLKGQKVKWEQELEEVNKKFSAYDKASDAKDRVADLETQFKAKVQMIANEENILIQCEEFQTLKDSYLTDEINKHFKTVRFQMFRKQKNGGVERVCDVYTKNGSPYGENTTSSAEKLVIGLEIVNVLSNIIGVKAPVIIDNGERVSAGNMPELDTQMIILSVSDDKDFRTEVR
nr:MAG TPA: chromosome partition protein [Caudoviricetes sp.]